MNKKNKFRNFLYKDVKEFNAILLILVAVFFISISGYISYALFNVEITSENIISLNAGNIPKVFNYTGDYQVFTVQKTGYYKIEAYGAQGGHYSSTYYGGKGGYTEGTILLNEGEKLYIYVGGKGKLSEYADYVTVEGGYNGGGSGITATAGYSGSGGGATDIRYFGSTTPTEEELVWDSDLGLNSRIMVAAGGGGAYYWSSSYYGKGGYGGGLIGGSGTGYYNGTSYTSTGGTQTETSFGMGVSPTSSNAYAGSGGGYYGGNITRYYSAAGGSSFISGYAGANAITSSTDRTHTYNTLHYSGKYFSDAEMKADFNEGHGKVKITYFGETGPERVNEGLNNVRYIKNCTNGNTDNSYNIWREFQAIYNGVNVAKGLTATGFTADSEHPMSLITDGDISSDYAEGSPYTGEQCVTIDLGQEYDLEEVAVWHHHSARRAYTGNIIYTSSDNETWTNVLYKVEQEVSTGIRINAYEEHLGTYSYTGGEQTITVANTGCYGFELWGAQGGSTSDSDFYGGKGGYTYGTKMLDAGTELFINIGGAGSTTSGTSTSVSGGYNGGGSGIVSYYSKTWVGAGGGATHVATASGLLKDLSGNKSSVIAVAGGGGGSAYLSGSYLGGHGGGYIGNVGNTTSGDYTCQAQGGKQTSTASNWCGDSSTITYFGLGRDTHKQTSSTTYTYGSGGGGGWYGGGGNWGQSNVPGTGAGGSGYIGGMNTDGSSYMYCYSCSTSSDNKTLTYSTTNYSGYAISKYAKNLNGAARVYYLGKTCPAVE